MPHQLQLQMIWLSRQNKSFIDIVEKTLIKNGIIVNEGRSFKGDLVLIDDIIEAVYEQSAPDGDYNRVVDAEGCYVMPGVIDEHVHFREPGLERKADIESESRAAVYGGVTSYFDMPNTNPQTTTVEALDDKYRRAAKESHINYSFFYGATNDNVDDFAKLDVHHIPGIKLFMGASTGNMLVDRQESLEMIFRRCADMNLPLMTHCEDTNLINENMAKIKAEYGDDPDVKFHPVIRDEKVCWNSSSLAVELAKKYGTRLHLAHVTTAKELSLFVPSVNDLQKITAEAVIAHLVFSDADYEDKGTLIKCNPAVKTAGDREALRKALMNGGISCVGTDHAPHESKDKQGGCCKAASGMPMIQFSLVTMLELVDEGVLTIERVVELMAHNPARLFSVSQRGFLRKGYKADIVIVKAGEEWTVTKDIIQSKCKWSPMEGHKYSWQVVDTFVNGQLVYDNGTFNADYRGEQISFRD